MKVATVIVKESVNENVNVIVMSVKENEKLSESNVKVVSVHHADNLLVQTNKNKYVLSLMKRKKFEKFI